ncbi:hypothetical protein BH11CYA1_BH11CYA1_01990 [soil metagenome]
MVDDAPLRKVVPLMRYAEEQCQLSGKKEANNLIAENLIVKLQEMGQGQALGC